MGVAYSWQIAQFLFKEETNEGTAVSLGNDDAGIPILADPDVDPGIGFQPRNAISTIAGSFQGAAGGLKVGKFRVRVPLVGSGTAGTAPIWRLLLMNGGFTEVDGASNVVYAYLASAWGTTKTATCALNCNGLEYKLHGARVKSMRLVAALGEAPILEAEIWGAHNVPTNVAHSTSTYPAGKWEAFAGTTGTFTYDSVTHETSKLEIDIENVCTPRPKAGLASNVFSVHGGPGSITASIDPTTDAVATYEFQTKMIANTEAALAAVMGSTAGSILSIAAGKAQIISVKPSRREHTAIDEIGLAFNQNSTTGCLVLTLT